MIRESAGLRFAAGVAVAAERQDHVGADQQLKVDLAVRAPVDASALGPVVPGLAAALLAATIENHLDVRVTLEALEQILVETGFVVGDQKEVAGHTRLHYLLTEHLRC